MAHLTCLEHGKRVIYVEAYSGLRHDTTQE